MIKNLIKKIAFNLDKEKVSYMIIGGQAVLLYGSPRLTRDIDITLGVDTDKFPLIEKICKKLKLKILPKDAEAFARETKVFPSEEQNLKIRIDFIFSFTSYERKAIKRATNVFINNYPVKFASCEDVIIHKLFAGRAIDEEDVKNIIIKNKDVISFRYIKGWLSKFSRIGEQKDILKKFNVLLKKFNRK